MKSFRAGLVFALMLSLTGCAQVASALPSFSIAAVKQSNLPRKILIDGEAGYNVAIHAYNTSKRAGIITPALDARLKPLVRQGHAVRLAAEAAYDASNASDLREQLAALGRVAAQIKAIVPTSPAPPGPAR